MRLPGCSPTSLRVSLASRPTWRYVRTAVAGSVRSVNWYMPAALGMARPTSTAGTCVQPTQMRANQVESKGRQGEVKVCAPRLACLREKETKTREWQASVRAA
jgi:hypothetical protein